MTYLVKFLFCNYRILCMMHSDINNICFLFLLYIDGSGGDNSLKEKEIVRKEMGLEWMLRPEAKREERPAEIEPEETKNEEVCVQIL